MGQFYSTLPYDLAESLVFCECEREDPECQQMKTSLHYGSCISDQSQMPLTCLDMLDSCAGDALCRQTFTRYLFECFGVVEAPFSENSTSDWLQHLDPDLFLEEEHQCRVAFVATMGSVLHNPCTCDGLRYHHQHKCNELQHMFQNKSLFKLSVTKKLFREKPSDKSSIEQQTTNGSSIQKQWLSGESTKLLPPVPTTGILMAIRPSTGSRAPMNVDLPNVELSRGPHYITSSSVAYPPQAVACSPCHKASPPELFPIEEGPTTVPLPYVAVKNM
ncbi:GDNF family receptor alpha-like [Xyrauchen texanus]|uniref:GDNF family receptor alpha-like n=1 Tax=Xyrauchen texanus TaxID=154827 RepID=UPI0022420A77|nr:GDNF family receptor alpha-like [Xyrauchen texanus]